MMEHLKGRGTRIWVGLIKKSFLKPLTAVSIVWSDVSVLQWAMKFLILHAIKVLLPLLSSFSVLVDKNLHVTMLDLLLTCVETGSTFVWQSCHLWADCWNSISNLETRIFPGCVPIGSSLCVATKRFLVTYLLSVRSLWEAWLVFCELFGGQIILLDCLRRSVKSSQIVPLQHGVCCCIRLCNPCLDLP